MAKGIWFMIIQETQISGRGAMWKTMGAFQWVAKLFITKLVVLFKVCCMHWMYSMLSSFSEMVV